MDRFFWGTAIGGWFRHPVGMTSRRRAPGAAIVALIGLLASTAGPAAAGVPADFPSKDALFHNYPEMVAEINAVEAANPDIVDVRTIGATPGGRSVWLAKVSDNVDTDEDEPEVLFDALHHGDEHLTVEQALYLFNELVDGYGTDAEVTDLVDSREIWIVFMVNPDGGQFDLTGDPYRGWRKNRQAHPTSSSIGTDLNRNYEYRWGCCGGSSGSPSSRNYRGWKAFSAPETKALSAFVNSRVIDGQQQIRTHITLHTNGELILYPYAYTTTNVPSDMTSIDRATFVDMAQDMAATNGYTVRQSGDWYISDGDQIDWMYGRHRIFSFTLELYPPEGSTSLGGHYPPDEKIAGQTARNREALLYLIDVADCPYRASGTQVANCGPLYDDLELQRGWTRNAFGEDTATTSAKGAWARGNPAATSSNGPKQLGTAASGSRAYVTGLPAGSSVDLVRPRWPDLDCVARDRATGRRGRLRRADVQVVPGPLVRLERHGLVPGLRRRRRHRRPDEGLREARHVVRRRRLVEVGIRVAEPLRGPDYSPALRGRRRHTPQPGRGRP